MENIVWLASYPKSGNTWFRMFLTNYIQKSSVATRLSEMRSDDNANIIKYFEEEMGLDSLELFPQELDLYLPAYYRIISDKTQKTVYKKVHNAYYTNHNGKPIFPSDISKSALYFIRNPLDVAVSYANHTSMPLEEIVGLLLNENCLIGGKHSIHLLQRLYSWVGHVNSWTKQNAIKTYVVRYEDMLTIPYETFGGIVNFLELGYDKDLLERSIKNCEFKTLQTMEEKEGFGEKSRACEKFFWKGTIGNYKNYLTEKQIHQIVEYCQEPMKEFGYIDNNNNLKV